ncbi:molybdopterin-dependent oxidoreductase [Methylocystis sp. B8]|uniref:SorA family sulfite dehydrogenase catalytic subunit n=1 Tax=Methylocystis sp. B8 TaxID=544938 RepID=UPI0010FCF17B|nr:molybdopterin-dependent oxidoreductase [Methylocystis sp. B8]TLG75513.1 oxidase [Methylocystis sp. B8]
MISQATSRRSFLRGASGGLASLCISRKQDAIAAESVRLGFANGERLLVRYPGKRALIQLSARPPQLETPFSIFNEDALTPNDAFFVRYHLADIPLSIDPGAFRLEIRGHVERPLSLSLAELKRDFDPVEIVAVNQCSGNSRGFVEPRVAGGQFGNGAMGNARWTGVALKTILEKAGPTPGARSVAFNGLDGPVAPETPDFVKSLDLAHAGDGEVMVAYAMNGEELPWLNGFPLRLVVPGRYGTYWVKHLNEIEVLDKDFDGFWMSSAYRIPDNDCACVAPGASKGATRPIKRLNVRSFITSPAENAKVAAHVALEVKGIAFDGGHGIEAVLLSTDDGASWTAARLGDDLGRYSFREWRSELSLNPGVHHLRCRAVNRIGQSQPMAPLWNHAGYMRNVVETVRIEAV